MTVIGFFFCIFADDNHNTLKPMLELNEVCLKTDNAIDRHTLTMIADEGQVTCLTGATAQHRTQLLLAMLGLTPVATGYISIDGEPVTPASSHRMRRQMAYVPNGLPAHGEVTVYEPPTAQDVFRLKVNRQQHYSTELLSKELHAIAPQEQWDDRLRLLATAVLLQRHVLLVDNPPATAASYLCRQAEAGRVVIVSSSDETIVSMADSVIEV